MLSKADISQYRDIARSSTLRNEESIVFVEGFRAISGSLSSGAQIDKVLVDASHRDRLDPEIDSSVIDVVDAKVIERIATTSSPQGAIAICAMPIQDIADIAAVDSPLFVLDNVSDPGNLGTIIRSCVAFGIKGLVTLGGCDPYHPKVVRSSAGTIFGLEIYAAHEFELETVLKDRDIYCADASGSLSLESLGGKQNSAFVFGSEAHGIITPFFANNAGTFSIDMAELCESLNVAMTSTIVAHQLMLNKSK